MQPLKKVVVMIDSYFSSSKQVRTKFLIVPGGFEHYFEVHLIQVISVALNQHACKCIRRDQKLYMVTKTVGLPWSCVSKHSIQFPSFKPLIPIDHDYPFLLWACIYMYLTKNVFPITFFCQLLVWHDIGYWHSD